MAGSLLERHKRGLARQNIARQPFDRSGNLPAGRQDLKVAEANMAVSGVIAAKRCRNFGLFAAQDILAEGRCLASGYKDRNRVAQQEVNGAGVGGTGRGVWQLIDDQPVALLLFMRTRLHHDNTHQLLLARRQRGHRRAADDLFGCFQNILAVFLGPFVHPYLSVDGRFPTVREVNGRGSLAALHVERHGRDLKRGGQRVP